MTKIKNQIEQTKDFNLSEREMILEFCRVYPKNDVKEFIRLLKKEVKERGWFCNLSMIDELAGDDLK